MTDKAKPFSGSLLPPPGEAPSLRPDLTQAQRGELWIDLLDASEAFLQVGLRQKIGPDGDMMAAFRNWYGKRMEEHDRTMRKMLERMDRAWRDDARQGGN